ncbi:MAG: hypothetical protein JXR70_02560 [Spirochaetales bacterium]|nr:hypothetical protein [Spirochaetales bacterium]
MMYWFLKKRRPRLSSFVLLLVLLFFSCSKEQKLEDIPDLKEQEQADAEQKAPLIESITKTYKRGPAELEVFVDKNSITIAEKLNLKLDLKIDKLYFADLPDWRDDPNQFTLVSVDEPTARLLKDDRFEYVKSFVLEPFLSGEYTIPSLEIKFWTEEEGEEKAHVLNTEPINITIRSLLPESREEMRMVDIKDVVNPPPPDMTWLYWVLGGLLLGAGMAVAIVLWLRYQREKNKPVPTIAAHELAYEELRRLVAENLIEKGELKLFYYRINDILRHYIENRFQVHAPEQTTEEFMASIQDSTILNAELKALLKDFMVHCDQVKFAEHVPSNIEVQNTFNSTRNFIQTTESSESRVEIDDSNIIEEVTGVVEGGQDVSV